jgi:uncharacterized protein
MLGYSVYVSTWDTMQDKLSSRVSEGSFVFTSLHIEEEIQRDDYSLKVDEMLRFLKKAGYKILADVSKRTLTALSFTSFKALKEAYDIDAFRLDFGFSHEEMCELSTICTVCVNASMSDSIIKDLQTHAKYPLLAMHNFYPREDTGLDLEQMIAKNKPFEALNIPVLAFIPSDIMKRGPMFEGLPTCEIHRYSNPLSNLMQLMQLGVQGVVVGDGVLSQKQTEYCLDFLQHGIVNLEVSLDESYHYLYNQVMTIRSDSPSMVCRILESRLYATAGQIIKPMNNIERTCGSITIDNEQYLRYSGEIQILKKAFKADHRVNVIGHVSVHSLDTLAHCYGDMKIRWVKENHDD